MRQLPLPLLLRPLQVVGCKPVCARARTCVGEEAGEGVCVCGGVAAWALTPSTVLETACTTPDTCPRARSAGQGWGGHAEQGWVGERVGV